MGVCGIALRGLRKIGIAYSVLKRMMTEMQGCVAGCIALVFVFGGYPKLLFCRIFKVGIKWIP